VFHGAPNSGKSNISKDIATFYNVPMMVIKEIIEGCKKREDELGEEVRAYLDERKETMVSEAREQLEHQKNQKKPNLPEDVGKNICFYYIFLIYD
jgi:adenylate kinase family enzyme